MSNSAADFISYTNFLKNSRKPVIRPCIWKGKDIRGYLDGSLPLDGATISEGRSAVSLINKDTGDALGVSPYVNTLVQVLKPGERDNPHRHSNFAIFIVFQGEGYSIVDGEKYEWEQGDVFFSPSWLAHEHCNTSDHEDAILYTIQDVPTVSGMGAWFLEEPIGSGPKHIVVGTDEKHVVPEK